MKSISIKHIAIGVATILALFIALTVHADSITTPILEAPGVTPNLYRHAELFATSTTDTTLYATTTDATSSPYYITGANRVTFYFSRSGTFSANTGTSTFKVEVSPDGTNWFAYDKLFWTNQSGTTTTMTRVTQVGITAATTTKMSSMDLADDSIYAVRCIVVEGTDGEHGCAIAVDF